MQKTINRLSRTLKTRDAVFIGLASMIGAGIFTAIAPAASVAQTGLLFGLAIAAFVAFCNASSSAQLARLYSASGGTYVYAQKRLNDVWAWLAGWGFVVGKLASCAAVALTFGYYLSPVYARYYATSAIIVFTIVNYFGIRKTAYASKILVSIVLFSLLTTAALLFASKPDFNNLQPFWSSSTGLYGVFQSAGIWFFAFAGYSRIATLGEEVQNPEKSIPRAILLALTLTLIIYGAVAFSALLSVGPAVLSQSNTPLVAALRATGFDQWEWLIRIGSTFSTLGVLLSLMTGISRTLFAMAADHKLPFYLAKVHPVYKVPYFAEITVGFILAIVVLYVDVRSAIGFSAFTVLLYYAVTNMAAYTLDENERLFNRSWSILGFVGCIGLALTLPLQSVLSGSVVMLIGLFCSLFQTS